MQWNKIEHRLFSHITLSWRGRPLTSHEVVVKTIAATTTRSGLRVEAALDPGEDPTGVAISKQRFDALPLRRHATHSAWNDTLHPRPAATATQPGPVAEQDGPARRRQAMLGRLADPRLTAMTTTDLQQLAAVLAPAQAARTQQRHSQQRGGRARRAAGKLRGRPLVDAAARLLLALVDQRQLCSMTVLADLLEVTETCTAASCTRPARCSKTTATAPPSPRCGSPPPATCLPSLTRTSAPPGPRSSTPCPPRPSPA